MHRSRELITTGIRLVKNAVLGAIPAEDIPIGELFTRSDERLYQRLDDNFQIRASISDRRVVRVGEPIPIIRSERVVWEKKLFLALRPGGSRI